MLEILLFDRSYEDVHNDSFPYLGPPL